MGQNGSDLVLVQIIPELNEINANSCGYSYGFREGNAESHQMNLLATGSTITYEPILSGADPS
jgi:hypothetical protein